MEVGTYGVHVGKISGPTGCLLGAYGTYGVQMGTYEDLWGIYGNYGVQKGTYGVHMGTNVDVWSAHGEDIRTYGVLVGLQELTGCL